MARQLPTFSDHEHRYEADTCQGPAQAAEQGHLRLEALVHGHYPGRPLPRGALPGVKSVGFWDASADQPWGLEWHRNEGIELTLLETGRVAFAVADESFDLRPDDLTITRPWQQHRVGNPNISAGRLHWLILDVGVRWPDQPWRWPDWIVLSRGDLDELTDFLRRNEQPVWTVAIDVRRCFQRIAEAVEQDRDGSSISTLAVRLNELLLLMLAIFRGREVVLDESLCEKRRTVELFLAELAADPALLAREWTVRRMARACGLGETRFSHYCRIVANRTPLRYLNDQRLETARRMLVDQPDRSVAEIASLCGFASPRYLATAFRRRFGSTPRQRGKDIGKEEM